MLGTTRDQPAGTERRATRVGLPAELAAEYTEEADVSAPTSQANLLRCRRNSDGVTVFAKIYNRAGPSESGVAEKLRWIDKDHVVPLYDYGYYDGVWVEIQEEIIHGSLSELLASRGRPVEPAGLERILDELTRAITALHQAGVVHRDIKPSNVLIRERAPLDLVLCDFGIAVVLDEEQRSMRGTISHTPGYSAPEAAYGAVSKALDWWSLGMTLLELATGHNYFDTGVGTMARPLIGSEVATKPIDVSGVADERWRHLLRGLLTRDPDRRWTGEQVQQWCAGGLPTVYGEGRAPDAPRAFTFAGRHFPDQVRLAEHLVYDWKKAGAFVLDMGEIDRLARWLDRQHPSDGVRDALAECRAGRLKPDRLVAALAIEMAPETVPSFRGFRMDRANLMALAREAAAPSPDSEQAEAIKRLRDSRALNAFTHLPGYEDYAMIDELWQSSYRTVEGRLGDTAALREGRERLRSQAGAGLLLMLTDETERAHKTAQAARAVNASWASEWTARTARIAVADDTEESEKLAAQWLTATTAPIEEQADQRRREEMRRAAEEEARRHEEEQERLAQQRRRAAEEEEARRIAAEQSRRRDRFRLANKNLGTRILWGLVLTAALSIPAAASAFASPAPGDLTGPGYQAALFWCGAWTGLGLLAAWLAEIAFGQPTRNVPTVLGLMLGLAGCALTIDASGPSVLGWAVLPACFALGRVISCALTKGQGLTHTKERSAGAKFAAALIVVAAVLLIFGFVGNAAAARLDAPELAANPVSEQVLGIAQSIYNLVE